MSAGRLGSHDLTSLALIAGAAWLAFAVLKRGIGELTEPLASATANAYVAMTNYLRGSGQVAPLGSVFLSDRRLFVPVAQLSIRMVPGSESAEFYYQGQRYLISGPHDENGNWAAVKG